MLVFLQNLLLSLARLATYRVVSSRVFLGLGVFEGKFLHVSHD